MRVTTKIIQNNSLSNININKTLQDTLSTQISTQKKIARPSDDPIVALRSLRLRTSVNQTEQYLEKNVEDAESWLEVTEDAIKTFSEIITDVRSNYTKGTSDTLTPSDRQIILENLTALGEELYNSGNADFAGRTVFTGYRTGMTLTYQKQETVDYTIFENEDTVRLDSYRYVHTPDLSGATHETEQDVYVKDITRIRLSYDDLMDTVPTVTLNGTDYVPEVMSNTADPYAYISAAGNEGKVVFVPETGEVLVGSAIGNTDTLTDIEVAYHRENWSRGDLRPEHYFKCKDNVNDVEYNYTDTPAGEIQYNIGVNQSLRINTNASDCYSHDVLRDVDDAIIALKEVDSIEKKISLVKEKLKSETDETVINGLNADLDALKKAQTFLNDKLHSIMSKGIGYTDTYLDKNNVALANCGTRGKRLELIKNRLDTQLSTLKELKSENEDVDVAETAIKLASAEYAYDAALMATSKILKESLINYI